MGGFELFMNVLPEQQGHRLGVLAQTRALAFKSVLKFDRCPPATSSSLSLSDDIFASLTSFDIDRTARVPYMTSILYLESSQSGIHYFKEMLTSKKFSDLIK